MKQLVIIGASGHGKVIADIARLTGYEDICFLDDNEALTDCASYPVAGKSGTFSDYDCDFFIAIGNPIIRQSFSQKLESAGKRLVTLVHPNAVIGRNVPIGDGTVVMAGAVINVSAKIGKGCIINTCASVDHDCVIENYVHIAVGAHVAGTSAIGDLTWIGAGATVSNNIRICDDCIIGAGAVVIKDIGQAGTYIGVPARMIR